MFTSIPCCSHVCCVGDTVVDGQKWGDNKQGFQKITRRVLQRLTCASRNICSPSSQDPAKNSSISLSHVCFQSLICNSFFFWKVQHNLGSSQALPMCQCLTPWWLQWYLGFQTWVQQLYPHMIHGTNGISTYIYPKKINLSCRYQYTSPMDGMFFL